MELVAWGLVTLVGAFVGSYLGTYFKKKGENLATQEDIDKLVEQVRAVTTTAKEIEAKISGDVWDRQKRWELKREVLFEATRRLSELDNALLAFGAALRVEHEPDNPQWEQAFHERAKRWTDASKSFDEARLLVAIACSKETKETFERFCILVYGIAAGIGKKKDADIYDKSRAELTEKLLAVWVTIRKELEIDRPA